MLLKVWYSLRGGSSILWPAGARASDRYRNVPSICSEVYGVRCARKVK